MQPLSTDDIRKAYLDFFAEQGHAVIPSASLLPENDPTTLFTGSGMQPMLPYLLGAPHSQGKRITDSQKSFRSVDIEEVGDNRHTTFFEMLGNWSLGDYFKREQIQWMFRFLTERLGLDASRLYVTAFGGNDVIARDEESVQIWQELFAAQNIAAAVVEDAEQNGMQEGRIFYYGEKKNWWSRAGEPNKMPVGEPGGPDSEMFWDFGIERGLHEASAWRNEPCHVNCDCGRFMEIGNNVFMEYVRESTGFQPLAQRNVDFGGGLERIAAALADNPDVFCIDLFDGLRHTLEELSGKRYGEKEEETRAFRIVLDHIRASVMLIADGAVPDNKDQGYFTRRMLRRAIRFASVLGIEEPFCVRAANAVIDTYHTAYPSLEAQRGVIIGAMQQEEEQFHSTLLRGQKEFNDHLATHKSIDGRTAFMLFETYGFPLELTEELLAEQGGVLLDPEGFAIAKREHQEKSRTASAGKFKGGLADHSAETTKLHTATHLLNAALRRVLGTHVQQKGSNITAERLRFDFTHPDKLTPEQIAEVEQLVNAAIEADLPVHFRMTTVEQAKQEGAVGVFEDRYGSEVKIYTIGDASAPVAGSGDVTDGPVFSKEICGGPHVARTGCIGRFTIKKEESSSAGVRRIKAVVEGGPAEIELATEAA